MNQATVQLLQDYYDAFNRQDMPTFLVVKWVKKHS